MCVFHEHQCDIFRRRAYIFRLRAYSQGFAKAVHMSNKFTTGKIFILHKPDSILLDVIFRTRNVKLILMELCGWPYMKAKKLTRVFADKNVQSAFSCFSISTQCPWCMTVVR